MKKFVLSILMVSFTTGLSFCKEKDKEKSSADLARYAQYSVSVRKDTDLKDWLATLNKCEKVTLLETVSVPSKEGKNIELARVRLADDKEGYVETRHLAKLPVFFVEDTDVYKRPTIGSQVVIHLPKGSIAFIQDEKDEWVQIYAGKVEGKYISNVWVQRSTFDTDSVILRQALDYEAALALLEEDKIDEALEKIDELRQYQSVIGGLASEKYNELTGQTGSEGVDTAPEGTESPDGTTPDGHSSETGGEPEGAQPSPEG